MIASPVASTANQRPRVVATPGGNQALSVIWQTLNDDTSVWYVHHTRLGDDLEEVAAGASDFPDGGSDDTPMPAAVWNDDESLPAPEMAVAWLQVAEGDGRLRSGVWFNRFVRSGDELEAGSQARIGPVGPGEVLAPTLTWLGGSSYAVAWEYQNSEGFEEIHLALVRVEGAENTLLAEEVIGRGRLPSIAWSGEHIGMAWLGDDGSYYFTRYHCAEP